MTAKKPWRVAIVYDFDGTLARGNMQEHSFLPELGVNSKTFWNDVKAAARKNDADEVLVYMWHMLELAKEKGIRITKKALTNHGKEIPLFAGVDDWFRRIDKFATERTLSIEHYVVSSGNHEIIAGSKIFRLFKNVYASRFIFGKAGEAVWPAVAINYTTKTQFLFRINKGIENSWDNEQINRWVPMNERPVPFSRMIFIGDGDTDIPSMKMVRFQGGHSIAVFDPESFQQSPKKVYRLIAEDRVHFVAPADYSDGSQLDVTIKGILARMARDVGYRGPD
ncbi:MAG TPA: HAD family hydrolase [Terriglobia bacterium]|nr:HAD family hydrolase [Terriglobia bacterium]